jgi:hypothetical protein
LRCDTADGALGAFREDAGLGMAEEQSTEHGAGSGNHRYGEIASHRQVSGRHAVMRGILSVARVLSDVVGTDDGFAVERRREQCGRARHWKSRESFARRAR